MLVVAPTTETLAEAGRVLGEPAPGRISKDRSDLDYIRIFASRPMVVGRAIGDLELPGAKAAIIGHGLRNRRRPLIRWWGRSRHLRTGHKGQSA